MFVSVLVAVSVFGIAFVCEEWVHAVDLEPKEVEIKAEAMERLWRLGKASEYAHLLTSLA